MDVKAYESEAERLVKTKKLTQKAKEELKLYNATMKINRLRLLEANIGLHLVNGYSDLERMTKQKMTDETIAEYKRQAGILGETVKDVETRAKSLVNQSFQNATWSERIWTNQTALKNTLSTELMRGMIAGKSAFTIASNIRKRFDVSSTEAKRLARTELVRCQAGAQIDSYQNHGWKEYEFRAYGSKSCEICRALNGKHYPLADAMPAENLPPMHPNCRCSTIPYEDEGEYQQWLDSFGNNHLDPLAGKSNIKVIAKNDNEGYVQLEALKGQAMTHKEADSGKCNPLYKIADGYESNCQSCVPVYEYRRRGYNVEALPKNSKYQERLSYGEWRAWEKSDGRRCSQSDCLFVPSKKNELEIAYWMNDIVQENERYSLAFSWGNGSGHEIVAYKENGRLRLYDPQADIMYYGEWILKLLSMVDKKQTRLFRIDDKKMVDSYLTAVMKGAE